MAFLAPIPLIGGLATAAMGAAANPKEVARTVLQFSVVGGGGAWVIFGLNGRRIKKMMDEGKDRTFDAAKFEMAGSGSGGGSSSPSGGTASTVGDAISQAGWPADLADHATAIANRESNGIANAVNCNDSNYAAGVPSIGLFQIILPTAQSVDSSATNDKLLDPVYNAKIAYMVYQNLGWQPWTTEAGWEGWSGMSGTPITTQTPNTDWGAYCVY